MFGEILPAPARRSARAHVGRPVARHLLGAVVAVGLDELIGLPRLKFWQSATHAVVGAPASLDSPPKPTAVSPIPSRSARRRFQKAQIRAAHARLSEARGRSQIAVGRVAAQKPIADVLSPLLLPVALGFLGGVFIPSLALDARARPRSIGESPIVLSKTISASAAPASALERVSRIVAPASTRAALFYGLRLVEFAVVALDAACVGVPIDGVFAGSRHHVAAGLGAPSPLVTAFLARFYLSLRPHRRA